MNIVLVDDHAVVRQGYASLLRAVLPTMEVREAASGEEALARVQEQVPNLVIMDFGLPGISGLETTRRLRQRLPQLRVLFSACMMSCRWCARRLKPGPWVT